MIIIATSIQVLDLLMGSEGNDLVQKLYSNTKRFREQMMDAGYTIKVYKFCLYIHSTLIMYSL